LLLLRPCRHSARCLQLLQHWLSQQQHGSKLAVLQASSRMRLASFLMLRTRHSSSGGCSTRPALRAPLVMPGQHLQRVICRPCVHLSALSARAAAAARPAGSGAQQQQTAWSAAASSPAAWWWAQCLATRLQVPAAAATAPHHLLWSSARV
jgi:hypothetical protein